MNLILLYIIYLIYAIFFLIISYIIVLNNKSDYDFIKSQEKEITLMKKMDFNRDWTVQKDGSPEIRHVNLPDDAMIREHRSKENKTCSASAYFAGGKYVYCKNWELPEEDAAQTLILEFEAVYQNATVFLNGEQVAEHPYGYTNFFVDVTGKVREGANELKVIADNANVPNTRWYSGSGIYREVQLYCAGADYIHPEGLKVKVVDDSHIHLDVEATLSDEASVVSEILFGDSVVATASGLSADLEIPDAHLWSAETPVLYTCKTRIEKNGSVADTSETTFGIRTLAWGKDGFLVNGKPVLLRGACIHHDNGVLGACGFRDAETRRVRLLKEAGFNAIRSAHNPMSKAMLDACDTLGMYVMDETFDMWRIKKNPYDFGGNTFEAWWKDDTAAMISKDYNHPSVVMYSIGNEITDLGLPDGQALARTMVDFCHGLDRTRPVTAGINLMLAMMAGSKKSIYGTDADGKVKDNGAGGMDNMPTSEFFNIMMNKMGSIINRIASSKKANAVAEVMTTIFDIPGYNYASSRYEKDAQNHPDQATTGSETLPQTLYDNWQLVKKLPTMTGDFMWTGYDYLGESGIGTVQYKDKKTKQSADPGLIISGGCGIIDICGKLRPEVGWGKIIWGLQNVPTLGVDPLTRTEYFQSLSMWRNTDAVESWSWEGCEGRRTTATVYSDAAQVELLLNGKSLGKKRPKKDIVKFKKVPYEAGKLEAVAFDASGKETGRAALTSASGKTCIQLTPETTTLHANGQDLCFLKIDLTDANGITKSSVDQNLKVEITGPATLQGYGSARPNIEGSFCDDTFKTFYGKSLAVIRAGYEAGTVTVRVSGEGLRTQEVTLTITEA